jgi:zinc D-Ala-D-Ala carboxypeptidase
MRKDNHKKLIKNSNNLYREIQQLLVLIFLILPFTACTINETFPSPEITPEPAVTGEYITPFPRISVFNLMNTPEIPEPEETAEPDELSPYAVLPYFNSDNRERYTSYKESNPDLAYEAVIVHVNIGLDKAFYEDVRTTPDYASLTALINKYNRIPADYVPELMELDPLVCFPGRGRQYLRPEAKEAFERMHNDARMLGLNILAYDTYRSIKRQDAIWNNALASGRSIEDVDSLNARGGHSEHNTGLAVDVIANNYSINNTKELEWYKEHAHEYGFIIRYPQGKEHITGYKYEPWHLRYLGVETAAAVYNSGLTYEEYHTIYLATDP